MVGMYPLETKNFSAKDKNDMSFSMLLQKAMRGCKSSSQGTSMKAFLSEGEEREQGPPLRAEHFQSSRLYNLTFR
uniref:Uncharacterized protein n=1 Tax=Scleropages formosus TaxID=113540 RepID=A0A8D0CJ53_SCLFO